ncbi:MAG TPA: VOC family protein [candidate division Zixibacteria bacterium]|nr:VOC family protein [candidate division Zixibacteria bacterium]
MLKPVGLINGHYECRSLDETLPIFTDLLAMEVVERKDGEAVLKHPNTEWRLIVHEGGPNAPNKPHSNHYGFRVASHEEIEAAYRYLSDHKAEYKIRSVTRPHEAHFAYSIYFKEPGGNDLEIEYYNPAAVKHGRTIAAPHWKEPLPESRFPGRGYVPQAMTHGTLNCDNKETSDRFLEQVLGLKIIGGGRTSTYVRHPDTPWYIVVLPTTHRDYLSPANRFTLKVATPEEVEDAHREFSTNGKQIGITDLWDLQAENGRAYFIFSDINRNWWEVTS